MYMLSLSCVVTFLCCHFLVLSLSWNHFWHSLKSSWYSLMDLKNAIALICCNAFVSSFFKWSSKQKVRHPSIHSTSNCLPFSSDAICAVLRALYVAKERLKNNCPLWPSRRTEYLLILFCRDVGPVLFLTWSDTR